MDMIVFLNVKPEDYEAFKLALEKIEINVTEKRPMTDAERAKKYRDSKKQQRHETVTECDGQGEEREEVPPLSPLPFPPTTPYPIPPISPLPEEREEGERGKAKAKNRYGNFGHVLLTPEEDNKLCQKFGLHDTEVRIQRLDDYLENNKKKHYDNHYLTILNWARRDEEKKPQQKRTYTFAEVGEMMERGEL